MGSCWDIRNNADLRAAITSAQTSEAVETIIKRIESSEQKRYTSTAIKVLIGAVILGGAITGSIYLAKISPMGAAALASSVALAVSGMKIASYTFKIPPFNQYVIPPNGGQNNTATLERVEKNYFLRKAAKALVINNKSLVDNSYNLVEFHKFRRARIPDLCRELGSNKLKDTEDYKFIFHEVLEALEIQDPILFEDKKKSKKEQRETEQNPRPLQAQTS